MTSVKGSGPDYQKIIQSRQDKQASRIDQGVKTGQLSASEEAKLRGGQLEIQSKVEDALKDGVISKDEFQGIRSAQNQASMNVYQSKHNDEVNKLTTNTPVVDEKVSQLKQMLEKGKADGSLTKEEASELEGKIGKLEENLKNAKSDGKVSRSERRGLNKEANSLFRDMFQKTSNDARGTPTSSSGASTPAASTPATSTPAASTPAASTPASSTPAASTPATSTPAASTPAASTPAASTPASSTPAAQAPTTSTPSGAAGGVGSVPKDQTPVLDGKVSTLQSMLEQGKLSGLITNDEAKDFQAKLDTLAKHKEMAKTSGEGFSPAERKLLNQEANALARDLFQKITNDQVTDPALTSPSQPAPGGSTQPAPAPGTSPTPSAPPAPAAPPPAAPPPAGAAPPPSAPPPAAAPPPTTAAPGPAVLGNTTGPGDFRPAEKAMDNLQRAINEVKDPTKKQELQAQLDTLKQKLSTAKGDNYQGLDEQGVLEKEVRDLGEKIIAQQFPLAGGGGTIPSSVFSRGGLDQLKPVSDDPFSADFAKKKPYQAPPDDGGAGGAP